ncbi:MAG: hypothetical protein ACYCZF_13305 [Anaerolineae bacterium]
MNALLIVALVSCGTWTPTPPATLPTGIMAPTRTYSFAIYLLATDVLPGQLDSLSQIELESEPILSIDDIITYSAATHQIELTASGYKRLHALRVPTRGLAFAVCVNGEPVYAGAFWTMLSSHSYEGVVILIDPIEVAKEPIIQVQLGYPGPDWFRGEDPRNDNKILEVLELSGKLR